MSDHPCQFYSCPECVGGQCFGGGCRYNPAPYAVPSESEEESEDGEIEGGDNE